MNSPFTLAASANVGPVDGGMVKTVTLTGGSDAATLILKYGGSGGTQFWATIKAAINTTVSIDFGNGVVYTGQLYALITGTAPSIGISLGI